MKKEGLSDEEVYRLGAKEKRLIVTFNKKHFEQMAPKNKNTGIIAVSTNVSDEQIDKKIVSLLSRLHKLQLYGNFHYIALP
ncbi:MAG: hypothetical protein UT63_C0025G0037 [Candidatus Gottesmanbacteria bacterium GW2011_GWC2_39_8]|uniref:DUF5615 domain-containing protein n=1 Tax=Candidatus Gottesmanbacteria bacterium GW2011_GWC2_39_8 TaxID=1618450 RepID=A0A0G0SEB6_9BACT|nr:MAG: hypothetical protein UT63_C0025G0037 [Candidatus Gottesmanbacteria bacterium GW2011_GWC2_39_8]